MHAFQTTTRAVSSPNWIGVMLLASKFSRVVFLVFETLELLEAI